TPSFSPTAGPRSARISFVPPPIQGTISLGIYDSHGKLVRVLHRESENDDFTIGTDALITEWDGKDDAGVDLPAGKYRARGYMVGATSVEGVADFFNDWVSDENSPHIKRINGIELVDLILQLNAELTSGQSETLVYDFAQDSVSQHTSGSNSSAPKAPPVSA